MTTTFSVSSAQITPGTTYKFALRARNIYGYASSISTVVSVTAIDVPDSVPIPSVVIGTGVDATKVSITWNNPAQTHGSAVDQYEVQFRTSTGTYVTDSSCNPSSALSSQFTSRTCLISMSTIRTITGQTVDQLIRVRVRAHNSRGWGSYSEINTSGATIETEPLVMSGLGHDLTAMTNTAVKLTWTAPTLGSATGGSSNPITSYNIYWDQGSNAAWSSLASTSNLYYLKNSLTGGTTYKFRIVAVNKYGEGPLSTTSTFSVVPGQVPDQPTGVSTSLPSADSIYVQVSWTAPSANNYALTRYQINFLQSNG